jgi:hypothetical protein
MSSTIRLVLWRHPGRLSPVIIGERLQALVQPQ